MLEYPLKDITQLATEMLSMLGRTRVVNQLFLGRVEGKTYLITTDSCLMIGKKLEKACEGFHYLTLTKEKTLKEDSKADNFPSIDAILKIYTDWVSLTMQPIVSINVTEDVKNFIKASTHITPSTVSPVLFTKGKCISQYKQITLVLEESKEICYEHKKDICLNAFYLDRIISKCKEIRFLRIEATDDQSPVKLVGSFYSFILLMPIMKYAWPKVDKKNG